MRHLQSRPLHRVKLGAIAIQKYAEEFGNLPPQNVDDPKDRGVVWLLRGLLEACLAFIDETPGQRRAAGRCVRVHVCAGAEGAHRPPNAGVDVQITYHDTSGAKSTPNETAMTAAGPCLAGRGPTKSTPFRSCYRW